MKCLVTAGNTQVLIDKVRCITNIFTGRTGAQIALELHRRGHVVTLLTSRPESLTELQPGFTADSRLLVKEYQTFDDLHVMMEQGIHRQPLDVIVHSAAVSDYLSQGIYATQPGSHFSTSTLQFEGSSGPTMKDVSAGKVNSNYEELWLRFIKAPKLVDRIRRDWGFTSKLVKFKLEVGITREQLQAIAEASRLQSQADLMVANTLEGSREWALLGPVHGKYVEITRQALACKVVDALGL